MATDVESFRFKVKLAFKKSKRAQPEYIKQEFIKYIVIENVYTNRIMPVIYVSMSVTAKMYNDIYTAQNKKQEGKKSTARFVLSIQRFNKLVKNAKFVTSLQDEDFDFIISNENPNYETEIEEADRDADVAFKTITVALLSINLLNAIRTERNPDGSVIVSGVFGNIDMNTLIGKVFEGISENNIKCVIKVPSHNTEFKDGSLIIPPMNSRNQVLKYLFDRAPFYNTPYTFFLDFGRAYLLDREQNGVKVKDNTYHDVKFFVKEVYKYESYKEGITKENKNYIVYINPARAVIKPNRKQDKVTNKIVTVDENAQVEEVDIDKNKNEDTDKRYAFKRGGNALLYKNIANSNQVEIVLVKTDIDASIFTPNKRYYISLYGKYAKYNGFYTMTFRKEVLYNNSGQYKANVEFGFKNIGDIEDIGDTDGDTGEITYRNTSSSTNAKNAINDSVKTSSTSASAHTGLTNSQQGNSSSNYSSGTTNGSNMINVDNSTSGSNKSSSSSSRGSGKTKRLHGCELEDPKGDKESY